MYLATLFYLFTTTSSLAPSSYEWRTSVDVPVDYSTKSKSLEQGVLLQGTPPSKKPIGLQLGKGYDEITIKPLDERNNTFKATLHAPGGKGYYLKISGYSISSGTLIPPFKHTKNLCYAM